MTDAAADQPAIIAALERMIAQLLSERDDGATICPSEAARAEAAVRGIEADGWRDLMPAARTAAAHLVEAGSIEVTQGGNAVDLSTVRGPIRLRSIAGRDAASTRPDQG